MKGYSKGVLFCLIATLSWGGMFPVMTGALERIDPFTFTSLRYSVAGLAFLAILFGREGTSSLKIEKKEVGLAWIFGTAGFAGFGFLVFLGQQLAGKEGALTAAIMMATQPMLGLLVNWIFRKVAPPLFSFLFILLSFCGVALVISKGHPLAIFNQPQSFSADILIIFGALCWVIYTYGATYFPKWSPYKYTTLTTLLGLTSVFVINIFLFSLNIISIPTFSTIISITPHIFYMAFIAGVIGVLFWNMGNKILTPLNGVLFMDIIPITAFTISAFQGLIPVPAQIFGATLTAIALILNNIYLRKLQSTVSVSSLIKTVPKVIRR